MPLLRRDGSYFGTLCALDPAPASLDEASFAVFDLMAQLISYELEAEDKGNAREAHIGALKDVISMAAHDLRQPLTSLLLRSQIMLRQVRREEVKPGLVEGLEQQSATIRRTISLTDKLLDVSRLETNTLTLDLARLDLVELIEQVVGDLKNTSPDHTFELQTPPTLIVEADAIRLNQVIRNLLDNAIKYSPYSKDPIEIKLSTLTNPEANQGNPQVILQIKDHGLGVKESDLAHLFERQFRTQEAQQAGISGSGFGLYISRQLIKAHGGEIWAERVADGGLLISFSLPLH